MRYGVAIAGLALVLASLPLHTRDENGGSREERGSDRNRY